MLPLNGRNARNAHPKSVSVGTSLLSPPPGLVYIRQIFAGQALCGWLPVPRLAGSSPGILVTRLPTSA